MKIFIAHTPYHALLSYGLARLSSEGRNIILYIPNDLKLTQEHVKKLLDGSDSPFFSTFYLNDGINQKPKIRDFLLIFRNSRFINKAMKDKLPSEVYVFNDGFIYTQYLINTNKNLGGTNFFIEDGSAVYSASYVRYGPLSNIASLIFFRRPFSNIGFLGGHPDLDQILVTHTDMVRPDMDHSKLSEIPLLIWTDIEDSLKRHSPLTIQSPQIGEVNNLLLLPLSDNLDRTKIEELSNMMEGLSSKLEGKTIVKYHPREKEKYLSKKNAEHFVEVEHGFPVEILLMLHKNTIKKVIGLYFDSTALITARDICGESVEIVSTSAIFNTNGLNNNVVEKIRIIKPSSLSDFYRCL